AKWVSEHYVDPQTQSVMAFRMKTQQKNIYGSSAWQDGWAGMFMHAWDPTYIESIYPAQKQNHLPILFGHSDVAGGQFEERLGLAFFAALASEVGDTALVKQALESVDRDWTPQWDGEGAYYYPRNDELRRGETGIVRMVEPLASNALIPFARLNRSKGLLNLHQHPWG